MAARPGEASARLRAVLERYAHICVQRSRHGGDVAALSETSDQPPHWNCYVTVDDVDVSVPIRGEEVTAAVSAVSAVPAVRARLMKEVYPKCP